MNEKLVVVIGLGPNSIEVPLLVFENKENARSFIEGDLKLQLNENGNFCEIDLESETEEQENDDDYVNPLCRKLFANDGNYYGGCGECYALKIKEIEIGKPIVIWNFD